jgi:hypothetical protein
MTINWQRRVEDARNRREDAEGVLQKMKAQLLKKRDEFETAKADYVRYANHAEPSGLYKFEEAIRKAEVNVTAAQAALQARQEEERIVLAKMADEELRYLHREFNAAVDELNEKLGDAATANTKVFDIYQKAFELFGYKSGVPAWYWPELLPQTSRQVSRLHQWRSHVGRSANKSQPL